MTVGTVVGRSTDESVVGRHPRVLPWLVGGVAAGLAWGVVCRVWMRYVSDVPSFSWEGTLFILGLTGAAGLSLGLVELLRRRGVGAWRLLAALPALVMFAGQGIPFAPPAVLGGLALSGRGGPWVRWPAALLTLSPAWLFWVERDGIPNSFVVTFLWFAAMSFALAVGWTAVWRRRVVR